MPATTPNHSHRWQFDLGNAIAYGGTAIATNRALLRALVGGLLAIPGVSVYRSCDSVAAGANGDGVNRWDSDSDLVWANAGTAHSWIVLQLPMRYDASDEAYLIIDLVSASAAGVNARLYLGSGSGGFSGGSITARPTTANEAELGDGGNTILRSTPTGGYTWHLWWAPSEFETTPATRCAAIRIALVDVATGNHFGLLVLEQLADLAAYNTVIDPAPVGGYLYAASSHVLATSGSGSEIVRQDRGGTPVGLFQVAHYFDGAAVEDSIGTDAIGRRMLYPLVLGTTANGLEAVVPDLWMVTGAALYTLETDHAAWVTIGNVALPHPIDTNAVGSTADEVMVGWGEAAPAPLLVELSPADGASLGATRDEARWAPIEITFTVPAGAVPIVWGYFGADPGIRHVIYDGGTAGGGDSATAARAGAFAPFFDRSTATEAAGVWTMSIIPHGGWWDSPTIRAGSYVEAV